MKICIFDRSNEKSHFSKTEICFRKKTTPQLLEHIGLQNMKVGDLISGDLPQYFKFVRWMLTSSLSSYTNKTQKKMIIIETSQTADHQEPQKYHS